ncbi:MAG: hypothetical protein HKM89_06280 [Gemmatimonadales bacterium]|nr:hypothetical protein [Gemmatimonadales bacterium]
MRRTRPRHHRDLAAGNRRVGSDERRRVRRGVSERFITWRAILCRAIHTGLSTAHDLVCTLSWLPEGEAYSIWFNRDERITRKPATSPFRHERAGISYLAPTDGEAGGTWIGVNAFGVTVCLANRYRVPRPPPPRHRVSRGLLVESVLGLPAQSAVAAAVEQAALEQYEPFTLGVFEPYALPLLLAWDGERLTPDRPVDPGGGLLLTSSAVDQAHVVESRRGVQAQLLAEEPLSATLLERLHASHEPERSGVSICMHRHDAQTQSLSRIDVGNDIIRFRYTPGSPCTVRAEPSLTLARVASSPTS